MQLVEVIKVFRAAVIHARFIESSLPDEVLCALNGRKPTRFRRQCARGRGILSVTSVD